MIFHKGDFMTKPIIRFLTECDKSVCAKMIENFFNSPAVSHPIPVEYIYTTIDLSLSNSPYVKILVAEINEELVGFCNLSFTYSSEVGGMVVLI